MIECFQQFNLSEKNVVDEEEIINILNQNEKKTKQVKKKKVYKPRMSKQQALSLQQQQKNIAQEQLIAILCRQPVRDHKYFIRGDLVIDFQFLREGLSSRQTFFCLNDFRPARNVQYCKSDGFYQIHFEGGYESIYKFRFIIEMLNSIGNNDLHQLAQVLESYEEALNLLDQQREEIIRKQIMNNDIIQESDWNYDKSVFKASKIIEEKLKNDEYFFYILSKGHQDYSELGIYGINENAIKMILGNLDHDSTVKILLQNGLILMNENFMDVIQMKLQETLGNLNKPSQSEETEYMQFSQQVSNLTINNHRLDLNFTYEKYRLSNYTNRFNDSLILARIDEKEKQRLMNQLFIQKLLSDSNVSEEKELLSDITYQAQSEYFVEKFYSDDSQS